MTQEEQRIAIAELRGWRRLKSSPVLRYWSHPDDDPEGNEENEVFTLEMLPDYPNDLNACHEMENHLTEQQKIGYYHNLSLWREDTGEPTENLYEVVHATAAQRCEAFLKTINLWKD